MGKRVYRGKCPYESFFEVELEGNCRNCEKYFECKRKERKRKRRVKARIKRFLMLAFLVIITFGVMFAAFMGISRIVNAKTLNDGGTSDNTRQTTTAVSTKTNQETETSGGSNDGESKDVHIDVEVNVNVEITTSPETKENDGIPSEETLENPATGMVIPVISADGPGEIYAYELTQEEKVYIAKVVYAESRGEPFEGQVAVAAVVLNRFVSGDRRFNAESIYTIVTQSGQFASIKGVTMENLNSVQSCMEAVEMACLGWDPTRAMFADGATFFFNPNGGLSEAARAEREGILTYRIGNHLFHIDLN